MSRNIPLSPSSTYTQPSVGKYLAVSMANVHGAKCWGNIQLHCISQPMYPQPSVIEIFHCLPAPHISSKVLGNIPLSQHHVYSAKCWEIPHCLPIQHTPCQVSGKYPTFSLPHVHPAMGWEIFHCLHAHGIPKQELGNIPLPPDSMYTQPSVGKYSTVSMTHAPWLTLYPGPTYP